MGKKSADLKLRLEAELRSFQGLWKGGFYKGDPLDPMYSPYRHLGYMGVFHVIYLTCIKPYVTKHSVVLEIGPGRGAWTNTFRHAKEIWCLDALSAEHNEFWDYVGHSPNIKYFHVSDFSCSMLPDNKFDYIFSYDALCHVSFEGITAYMKNMYPKLKKGAHCFIMVADYEKYNSFLDNADNLNVLNALVPCSRKHHPLRWALRTIEFAYGYDLAKMRMVKLNIDEDNEPRPGRWYHAGKERTCKMLRTLSYEIIDPDVGADHVNPIIHFVK